VRKNYINFVLAMTIGFGLLVCVLPTKAQTEGATLFLSPDSTSTVAGKTFEVSVFLDTGGNTINTLDVFIKFPSDKLQVVSPSIGKSIIGIWTSPPGFNNSIGEVHFRGGIPAPGTNTPNGLISTITFRAKSVGIATVSFGSNSKILLNDGYGTNVLTNMRGASYNISLPQSEGPTITSPTHPDQNRWYKNSTPALEWTSPFKIDGSSYVLTQNPIDVPDDISEGSRQSVSYKNLADGLYYFHLKAISKGTWGGVSRYAIKIDNSPPAKFTVDILPNKRTSVRSPLITFDTTDAISGLNHYELKIVPRNLTFKEGILQSGEEGFFIEVPNRYVIDQELDLGDYDVIVRAFDNAGNFEEVVERLSIVSPLITASTGGITILNKVTIPWWLVLLFSILIALLFSYLLWLTTRLHRREKLRELEGAFNDPEIRKKLEELHKLEEAHRRRKTDIDGPKHRFATVVLFITVSLSLCGNKIALAQENSTLPPPIITTVSESITNDELFYVVGVSDVEDSEIIIYIQNLQDNQLISATVVADKKGDWFYAYQKPLPKGSYTIWTQMKVGNQLSRPSKGEDFTVSKTALQIGASRLSYETLYLILTILFSILSLILGGFTAYHFYHSRIRKRILIKEIKEAESVIRDGFISLHKDIQSELETVHKAKMGKQLSEEEERREKKLLSDLEHIELTIKKEFADVKFGGRAIE
jgi:hypothetical protein